MKSGNHKMSMIVLLRSKRLAFTNSNGLEKAHQTILNQMGKGLKIHLKNEQI